MRGKQKLLKPSEVNVESSNSFLSKLIKIFGFIWGLSIVSFIVVLGIATGGFNGVIQNTKFGNSPYFLVAFLASVGIGVLAFALMILAFITRELIDKGVLKFEKSFKGFFIFMLRLGILLTLLPLFFIYKVSGFGGLVKRVKKEPFKLSSYTLKHLDTLIGRLALIFALCITFLPVWLGGYAILGFLIGGKLGYIAEPMRISGTGSMFPTFPKGEGKDPKELAKQLVATPGMLPYPNGIVLAGKRLFGHEIAEGDIVIVENDKIHELNKQKYGDASGGWVKRVIGRGGDTIELRSGIVYLNEQPLKEQYTAKAHSTFGESFLKECQKYKIPNNSIFVMGDNRKGSGDSREVGSFSLADVRNVLPFKSQGGNLVQNWRDTSKDFDEASKIRLDKTKYLKLLNEKRKEANAKPLKYQPKLEVSASKRGEVMLKYDDFSFEATRSGYTMNKAMNDAKYSNIVSGEARIQGYFDAEELVENQFEFPESKKFYVDKTYQEVGISEVEGEINGCPAQVIVQHFAGYVPPNYKQEDIDSWQKSLDSLRNIQGSWAGLKSYARMYEQNKADIDRIVDIINIRIVRIDRIALRMKANQWLTNEEKGWADQDKALYDEQEALATKLNSWKP